MVCYSPLKGWRGAVPNQSTGRHPLTFNPKDAFNGMHVTVPCGNCVGCRFDRSRDWAVRSYHEASMHQDNAYITLTYADEHLPTNWSLDYRDFQLFLKRLRKKFTSFSYLVCGEYTPQQQRPHFHSCLFGIDFPDKIFFKLNHNGDPLYTSEILTNTWGKGHCTTGDVTYSSAGYVARYVMKKITGDQAVEHYGGRTPEFIKASTDPAIGKRWFDRWHKDVFPSDFVIADGKKKPVPRYYKKLLKERDEKLHNKLKRRRKRRAAQKAHDSTDRRLLDRQKVAKRRLQQLPRTFEGDYE